MKIRALVLTAFVVLGYSAASMADDNGLDILCTRTSANDCAARVEKALTKLGCAPVAASIDCQDAAKSAKENGKDVCSVETANCSEPRADLVFTTHCDEGSKVSLGFGNGLTLTWWMGFGPYLRSVCKK